MNLQDLYKTKVIEMIKKINNPVIIEYLFLITQDIAKEDSK